MLDRLTHITIAAFCFLFPLFFLPFTADTHEYSKLILLLVADSVLLILLGLRIIQEKKIILTKAPFTIPLLALVGSAALSTAFQASNPFLALTTPLSFSTILGMTMLYLLLLETDNTVAKLLMFPVIVSAILVSIYSIVIWFGLLPFSIFTPAGNLLATAMSLGVIAIYVGMALFRRFTSPRQRLWYLPIFIVILTASVLLTRQLFTTHRPIVLPFAVGTRIAASLFEHPRTILLGVGMANFVSAFTMEKPLSFNQSQYWNISFTSSSSYFLTLLTESGILAAMAYVTIFFLAVFRSVASLSPASVALLAALLFQLVLPGNMTISTLSVLLMILAGKNSRAEVHISRKGFFSFIPAGSLFLIAGAVLYAVTRSYLAELYFNQSLLAMNAGRGKDAYELQQRALKINPTLDRYYLTFSQTNLVLANVLAGDENPSAQAKTLIPSLVQQSLDAAKTAAAQSPANAANWTHLGSVYASLIGFAQDSDRWAIENYEKALVLDPHNPSTHVAMASVYQKIDQYDAAVMHLQKALELKPDFTAASVFLAKQQLQLKKTDEAKKTLEEARSRVPAGSQEYMLIEEELKKLVKN